MSTKKEVVLVLDDDPAIANTLCETLKIKGFETEDANTLEQAEQILSGEKVDILVFDIGMDQRDLKITSIDLAIKANKIQPRPTLFFTAYDQQAAPDFFQQTRQIEHSLWVSRKGRNWDSNIINSILLAKEFFKFHELKDNVNAVKSLRYKNQLNFKEWRGAGVDRDDKTARRLFLPKDEILFVTTDRNRKIFKEAFEPDSQNYCVVFTRDAQYYRFGAGLGSVAEQLEQYYPIGWNFRRVHGSYIINMDYLKEYKTQDGMLFLQGLDFPIPASDTFFPESEALDLFPILVTS